MGAVLRAYGAEADPMRLLTIDEIRPPTLEQRRRGSRRRYEMMRYAIQRGFDRAPNESMRAGPTRSRRGVAGITQ